MVRFGLLLIVLLVCLLNAAGFVVGLVYEFGCVCLMRLVEFCCYAWFSGLCLLWFCLGWLFWLLVIIVIWFGFMIT